jgi:hypothetical protein
MLDVRRTDDPDAHQRELTVHIAGTPENGGEVTLGTFLGFFTELQRCLRSVDRLCGESTGNVHYRVAGLAGGSATVTIEAFSESPLRAAAVVSDCIAAMEDLERGRRPATLDGEALEAFEALARQATRGITCAEISYGSRVVTVTHAASATARRLLASVLTAHGTATGLLEAVSVHGRNVFSLYPKAGPRTVKCRFPDALLPDVGGALKRFVTVDGTLHYRAEEAFPFAVDAQRIVIHPRDEDLPTFGGLLGAAPEITDGLDALTFLQLLREGEPREEAGG